MPSLLYKALRPFLLAFNAFLLLILLLSLPRARRAASRAVQAPLTPTDCSLDPDLSLDDPDDWIPEDSDPWTYQLTQPDELRHNRARLERCFYLHPANHSRS